MLSIDNNTIQWTLSLGSTSCFIRNTTDHKCLLSTHARTVVDEELVQKLSKGISKIEHKTSRTFDFIPPLLIPSRYSDCTLHARPASRESN
mmetsp:Transcript_1849/g.2619  ORF Transcript_1849/g.2619 Transcript_1849/m.2619 type:complete len:91 (-) Transcript_1849:513-785(-)